MAKSARSSQQASSTFEFLSGSVEETQVFGERLGRSLRAGDVVALYGELGSGKTTLIQGLAHGLDRDPATIKSPTFVLMREYPGEIPLVHVDGYRLEGAPAVSWLDLDLVFSPHKITVIEWAARFAGCLPADYLEVLLVHKTTKQRKIAVVPHGSRSMQVLEELKQASSVQATSCKPQATGQNTGRDTDAA